MVDIGPGAGVHGGEVVAAGSVADICACPRSVTGEYLSGKKKIPVPARRRKGSGRSLLIRGASENNLRHIDVEIPLGMFTCVTGVSGSGKSSLINEVLYKTLGAQKNRMVIDIGGGTTEVAVVSLGGVVECQSIKTAGDAFDEAIVRYVRRKHNILVGQRTAEELKRHIGCVMHSGVCSFCSRVCRSHRDRSTLYRAR